MTNEFKESLVKLLPQNLATKFEENANQITLHVQPENVNRVLFFLRDNSKLQFKQLTTILIGMMSQFFYCYI